MAIMLILFLILMIATISFHLRKLSKIKRFDSGLFALHACQRMHFHFLANNVESLSGQEFKALRNVGLMLEYLVEFHRAGKVVTYSACDELKEAFEVVQLADIHQQVHDWLKVVQKIYGSQFQTDRKAL